MGSMGTAQQRRGDSRSRTPRSSHFTEFISQGWAQRDEPLPDAAAVARFAARRRAKLSAALPDHLLLIPAGVTKVRSNDTDYRFRPHSAFTHLTGWGADAVPGAVLMIHRQDLDRDPVLFFRRPAGRDTDEFYADPAIGEFWNGPRPGLDAVSALLGIGTADLSDLAAAVAGIGTPIATLPGLDPDLDALIAEVQPERSTDVDAVLEQTTSEMRLVKDVWEQKQIRQAVAASKVGFDDVLSRFDEVVASPRGERIIEGAFWARARELGNDVGYDTIAAAGDHACYLHWTRNDGAVRDGDLVLIDAGVEADSLYTADVTRTLPVSGTFTPRQREVYEAVLEAADAGFAAAQPGARFREVHEAAIAVIARKVSEWGLLPVSLEQTLETEWQLHRRFMVHGTSHHLGLDVHDCAQARRDMYLDALLTPGMVFTIEPGLYFQADDLTIPEDLRGIGVRIEDDVLVTEDGVESLTAEFPRTVDEIERWVRTRRASIG